MRPSVDFIGSMAVVEILAAACKVPTSALTAVFNRQHPFTIYVTLGREHKNKYCGFLMDVDRVDCYYSASYLCGT